MQACTMDTKGTGFSYMPRKYTVIDLFAGCGGLSLGLHNAGWQGLFAIEKNPDAFKTLKHNLIEGKKHFDWPDWLPCTSHDIQEVLKTHREKLLDLQGKVDLVAGGPPCQGFSMAGKREEKDSRNQLVFSYIEFIELVKPRVVLFENVKGFDCSFTGAEKSVPYSHKVKSRLEKLGYKVVPHVYDFSDYGVPQKRKRYILVGILDANENPFRQSLDRAVKGYLKGKGIAEHTTVQDAISDLCQSNGVKETPDRKGFLSGKYAPALTSYQRLMRKGLKHNDVLPDSHSFAHHSQAITKLFATVIDEEPHGIKLSAETRKRRKVGRRSLCILDENSPAPTLTSNPDDVVHYQEPRILTVREYARIQTFPDWFEFKSKYTTGGELRRKEVPRYTQIANAVPPLFAELAGRVIKDLLNECYE